MKESDRMISVLMSKVRNSNDILLPNFYHLAYEMDVFNLTDAGYVVEYEVKISVADFKNDFTKGNKHATIKSGKRCNRFYFATPYGLISKSDVPEYAGLVYVGKSSVEVIKVAPLLSKEKFPEKDYRSLAVKLARRVEEYQRRMRNQKIIFDSELSKAKFINSIQSRKQPTP